MVAVMLDQIEVGTRVLSATGEVFTVSDALAAEFNVGDRIVANSQTGLLHLPAQEFAIASHAVARCTAAFEEMDTVTDEQIFAFFHELADRLGDDKVWRQIERVNEADVADAKSRGRSITRLTVSETMRQNMIDGLRGWASTPSRRNAALEQVERDGFRVELVGAALGVSDPLLEYTQRTVAPYALDGSRRPETAGIVLLARLNCRLDTLSELQSGPPGARSHSAASFRSAAATPA